MWSTIFNISVWAASLLYKVGANGPYQPTWSSLDTRPLPEWYDDAKFGIFMHWGVYSVPAVRSEWFWMDWTENLTDVVDYMDKSYRPGFRYPEFASQFRATFFNATDFAELVKNSGARYYVFTSKHHEGYTMYPSKYSWNWNSQDIGPGLDIVADLAAAFRSVAPDVHFGLYYSLYEWFNSLYLSDKQSGFKTRDYVNMVSMPQLMEIVNQFKPDIVWSDGDWEASDAYWNSTEFIAWLYNESPVKDQVVTNDRWGSGVLCQHGDFYTCADRFSPGELQKHKWENCMTVDKNSWGYRRNLDITDVMTIEELITMLVETISCGGNLLMNVGPNQDGIIVPIFQERLAQMGQWLAINGQAVYGTKPWVYQNDTVNGNVWYTSSLKFRSAAHDPRRRFNAQIQGETIVYAFILQWPANGQLILGAPKITSTTTISMLGYSGTIHFFVMQNGNLLIDLTTIPYHAMPSKWAWVLSMSNLQTMPRSPFENEEL